MRKSQHRRVACISTGISLFFIVAATLIIASCKTTSITLYDAGLLRKAMSVQEANGSLPLPPEYILSIDMDDSSTNIQVDTYILSSGSYSSDYFLAFRNNQLLYWGYPHEFARSVDPLINEIGRKAVVMLSEKIAERKAASRTQTQKAPR